LRRLDGAIFMSIHDLRAKRATIFDAFKALGEKKDFDPAKDQAQFDG
jgi:hypothetical protein